MKEKLIFAAEVLTVFAVCYFVQSSVFQVPVLGQFLPGGKPPAA